MISLDANIVLRFLLDDVPTQTGKARQLFLKPKVYASDVVISEIAFVLEKAIGFDRVYISLLLRTLVALPNFTTSSQFLPQVISLFETRKSLSFVDCYAATEARVFGGTLYTFDKKLVNQGGEQVRIP